MRIPLRHYWQLLAGYLRPQWPRVLLLAALILGGIGLQLANPQIMRAFIDGAQAGDAYERLLRLALLFIAAALIQQLMSVAATYLGANVAWLATNSLRARLADHCLRLDLSFHNAHTPGEMIERIDGDVLALTNFFSQFVIRILGNALLLAGILVLLWAEDPRVGLALSLFAALSLLILGRFRNIAVPYWKAERQASAELFGFLEERLAGTEDIRANGAEAYVMRRFFALMRELLRRSLRAGLMVNVLLNSSYLIFALGNATAFAVGAWLYQAGALTIGSVYLVFHYANMIERPINQIVRQMEDLQKAGAAISRVQELLSVQSRLPQPAGDGDQGESRSDSGVGRPPEAGPLAVEFRDVSFRYDDDAPPQAPLPAVDTVAAPGTGDGQDMVLSDVSFRLPAGAVLGLLGRTGSGKTTLTRLLFRFYDPERGAVLLGGDDGTHAGAPGTDLRRVPLGHLRRRVGMVTQSVQLFHASVRDNLTFFDPAVPDERIWQVVRELGLDDWFGALPNGLDTVLESGGGGLSAGEAQLLAFMRIFLQDPGLVILDEASSRLDPATERLLERAVSRLLHPAGGGRTAIIVAHRLATVQRADRILILDGGRVVEYGDRAALAADPDSHFHHLLETGQDLSGVLA